MVDQLLELFAINKVIIYGFGIGRGLIAGGARDREYRVGDRAIHAAGDGGFARARRSRDHQEEPVVGVRREPGVLDAFEIVNHEMNIACRDQSVLIDRDQRAKKAGLDQTTRSRPAAME